MLGTRLSPPHPVAASSGATACKLTPIGRTPGSAADAPVGLLALCKIPISLFRRRDEGVLAQTAPRSRGPPHQSSHGGFSQPVAALRRRTLGLDVQHFDGTAGEIARGAAAVRHPPGLSAFELDILRVAARRG